jgi:hypothetical protein
MTDIVRLAVEIKIESFDLKKNAWNGQAYDFRFVYFVYFSKHE